MTCSSRTALGAGEHRLVDGLGVLHGAEDQPGAGTPQRLVRRAGDHLRVRHRRRIDAARHQPGEVGHVHQEERSDLVGDGSERREVDDPGVGAAPGDDQLGLLSFGLLPDLVVIDPAGRRIDTIVHRPPDCPAVIDRRAVRQVASVRKRHPHEQLTRRDEGHEGREVGLGPGVRLHVGVLGAEELLEPVDGQLLDLVHDLAAAVVPPARVPLGVLVGQRGAHGVDHRPAGEVLAGDQLQPMLLPAQLGIDEPGDSRIGLAKWCVMVESHWPSLSIFATRRLWRPPSN